MPIDEINAWSTVVVAVTAVISLILSIFLLLEQRQSKCGSRSPLSLPLARPVTQSCWVCAKPLDASEEFLSWDGTRWFLASPEAEPGRRATHLACSPDPKAGAPMTADDEAALDAGFNPWKVRREIELAGE